MKILDRTNFKSAMIRNSHPDPFKKNCYSKKNSHSFQENSQNEVILGFYINFAKIFQDNYSVEYLWLLSLNDEKLVVFQFFF